VLSIPREKAKTFSLVERKSVFVTDQAILNLFAFDELIWKLAGESKSPKISKE
jgi:hypothetical protein